MALVETVSSNLSPGVTIVLQIKFSTGICLICQLPVKFKVLTQIFTLIVGMSLVLLIYELIIANNVTMIYKNCYYGCTQKNT